ncbi:MAG: NMD3-related protein [Promethearchaeota archaeon]
MPNRFCAICGTRLETDSPHFGMCLKCYLKENPLFNLPKSLSLNICIDCGSYSKKDVWILPSENELFSIIKEAVHKFLLKPLLKKNKIVFFLKLEENSFKYTSKDFIKSVEVEVKGNLKGNSKIEHKQIIKLIFNPILCKNCSNLRGGTYFISIIQLRVKNENNIDLIYTILNEINNFVNKLFEKDPRQYISKFIDQKYGIDLYLSTNELMNSIIKFLKSKYHFLIKRTKKLIGRDSQKGKNLYRLKASIKILPINVNDKIIIGEEYYNVENITKKKIILRSKDDRKLIKDYNFFFSENIMKRKE